MLSFPCFFPPHKLPLTVPTLTPVNPSVSVTEGRSVTLTCTPSDPHVQIEWYFSRGFLERFDLTSISNLNGITYDGPLRHSLIISAATVAGHEGVFVCGVLLYFHSIQSNITLNVIASKILGKLLIVDAHLKVVQYPFHNLGLIF